MSEPSTSVEQQVEERKPPMREEALAVVGRLRESGFSAYFVGGCVRDELLGLPLKDIDIATDARPEAVQALFPKAQLVGAAFGVVIVHRGGHQFEVATFRRDGEYRDHRHPETVTYGTMEEDAARRDFTCNGLYFDPVEATVIDLVGGRTDLQARRLRCIGDPAERFQEDALRLLRAIRFATRLGFKIEELTWRALKAQAHLLAYISPERVRDELTGMLTGPAPGRALELLRDSGLLEIVLPDVAAMDGVEQGKQHHPEGDVFRHTCLVLDCLEPRTPVTAWAALLHDIGKPATFRREEEGRITFYEHQSVGAAMAEEIMVRLRFSRSEVEAVRSIVARHMQFMNVRHMRPATLRRFLAAPTIAEDLAVHRADCLGCHGKLDAFDFVRGKLHELESEGPGLPPPLVSGHELIAAGYTPGPRFREILEDVQTRQLEGEITTPDEAMTYILGMYSRD